MSLKAFMHGLPVPARVAGRPARRADLDLRRREEAWRARAGMMLPVLLAAVLFTATRIALSYFVLAH